MYHFCSKKETLISIKVSIKDYRSDKAIVAVNYLNKRNRLITVSLNTFMNSYYSNSFIINEYVSKM